MKKGNSFLKNRRGQIWVETVIYTLIALVMIGLVLAFARPKIQELQDKAIIEQTITMMKEIDSIILNMGGEGNKRILELGIKKGEFIFDGENDRLFFEMESHAEYSELDVQIDDGNLIIETTKDASANIVSITRNYESYDLRVDELDGQQVFTKSSVVYKISLTNRGSTTNPDSKIIIDMELQ